MQNHEVSRIPLVTHRPFAKFATEPPREPDFGKLANYGQTY